MEKEKKVTNSFFDDIYKQGYPFDYFAWKDLDKFFDNLVIGTGNKELIEKNFEIKNKWLARQTLVLETEEAFFKILFDLPNLRFVLLMKDIFYCDDVEIPDEQLFNAQRIVLYYDFFVIGIYGTERGQTHSMLIRFVYKNYKQKSYWLMLCVYLWYFYRDKNINIYVPHGYADIYDPDDTRIYTNTQLKKEFDKLLKEDD
jgi:hypothetical protein